MVSRLRTCDVCKKSVEDSYDFGRTTPSLIDVVGVSGFGGVHSLADMCRDCFKAFRDAAEKWVSDRK